MSMWYDGINLIFGEICWLLWISGWQTACIRDCGYDLDVSKLGDMVDEWRKTAHRSD